MTQWNDFKRELRRRRAAERDQDACYKRTDYNEPMHAILSTRHPAEGAPYGEDPVDKLK
jgi:hypothetical protein